MTTNDVLKILEEELGKDRLAELGVPGMLEELDNKLKKSSSDYSNLRVATQNLVGRHTVLTARHYFMVDGIRRIIDERDLDREALFLRLVWLMASGD